MKNPGAVYAIVILVAVAVGLAIGFLTT